MNFFGEIFRRSRKMAPIAFRWLKFVISRRFLVILLSCQIALLQTSCFTIAFTTNKSEFIRYGDTPEEIANLIALDIVTLPLQVGAVILIVPGGIYLSYEEYKKKKETEYWENVIANDTKNVSFEEAKKHLKYERTRRFINKKIENAMKDLRENTEPEFDFSEFLIFLDEIGYKRTRYDHAIYPEEYSRVVYQRIGTETNKQKIEEHVFLLISNPLTPPEILRELSIHEYSFLLLSGNPNTPPDVLSEIMKKMAPVFLSGAKKYWTDDGREIDTFGVILRLSGNPNTPPEVLFNIYYMMKDMESLHNNRQEWECVFAQRRDLPEIVYIEMAEYVEGSALHILVNNPSVPYSIKDILQKRLELAEELEDVNKISELRLRIKDLDARKNKTK